MEVNFAAQTVTFLISLAVGAGLCLLYDVFRIVRLVFRPKGFSVFLQDILYAFLAAAVTYLLLLVRCRGEIRGYPLLGELCGFVLCRFTVSGVLYAAAVRITALCRRLKKWLIRRIFRPIRRAAERFFLFLGQRAKKLLQIAGKFAAKAKKGLKHRARLVYNHTVRKTSRGPTAPK